MVLVIGEILFDIFPAYKRIGGASFNFAFHLKKLGCPVRFVSRICNDPHGREILGFLEKHDFDLQDIQIDQHRKTGYVDIEIKPFSDHTFTIAEDTAYDHIQYTSRLEDLVNRQPELIYFGTLIQRSKNNFKLLQKISNRKTKKTRLFCDINLRPGCYTEEIIRASLKMADILKLNREELLKIMDVTDNSVSYKPMVGQIMATHQLDTVILTLGSQGSQWFTPHRHYTNRAGNIAKIMDTVGAGDAYAAMSVAGFLHCLPLEQTACLAHEFASHICGIKGALPNSETIYPQFIDRMRAS